MWCRRSLRTHFLAIVVVAVVAPPLLAATAEIGVDAHAEATRRIPGHVLPVLARAAHRSS